MTAANFLFFFCKKIILLSDLGHVLVFNEINECSLISPSALNFGLEGVEPGPVGK